MTNPASVLVVGASVGGLAVAESLRRDGYAGALTLLGAERHPPYDRPPLSKKVLAGEWEPDRTRLRADAALAKLEMTTILGDPAVHLDVLGRAVTTASGRRLTAEAIVLATGLEPRRLPGQAPWPGVHVLRTLDDAVALRAELLAASQVVVVGDGVLGTEAAATARAMGLAVTLVGPQATLLASQLGPQIGGHLAALHTRLGVQLRLGAAVEALVGDDERVRGVRLAGGEVLPADVVVVAIGSRPATDWLFDSGLRLGDGVVCDSRCRAAEGIYAVGDVARWHHEVLGTALRLENRSNAVEQGAAVAANILGKDRPYTPVPFFWTDQYDVKIQVHGFAGADAQVAVVDGSPEAGQFAALYGSAGKVTGVLGWNMVKQTRALRQHVVEGTDWSLVKSLRAS
ncbi:FAD-dependent oxidoreductase [Nannocystis sp. ILAH1]|uniref:NAD(P)/FAD-dependent oxidoreductase n=1 Tax=unclassified Nannocystis TaxID=2627009 RepID=UPI0022710506|nr:MULTISPECIES: FAD-dependent oxidoreductase [unclassified Nannocystis]MCY0988672.1 FAD-dependent oxidoreductase [Nannocystis sp. ILAH1]MCY1072449.1 FAD-dependent oxidoreductase [Nannocystis sp. RBIL2]